MEAVLRAAGVPVGIVTDGRWWGLVCARDGEMAASGIVDAQTWAEEREVRDAFLTLLHLQRLVGGKPEDRLPALFAESVAAAEEITEALGVQVRRAVELLVRRSPKPPRTPAAAANPTRCRPTAARCTRRR